MEFLKKTYLLFLLLITSFSAPADVCIKDIQGKEATTPVYGEVKEIEAFVSHKVKREIYIGDVENCKDNDPATNNYLTVLLPREPIENLSVGDIVKVKGKVSEYRPDFNYKTVRYRYNIDSKNPLKLSFEQNPGTKTETTLVISNVDDVSILSDVEGQEEASQEMVNLLDFTKEATNDKHLEKLLEQLESNRVYLPNAVIAHPYRGSFGYVVSTDDPKITPYLIDGKLKKMIPSKEVSGYIRRFKVSSAPSDNRRLYGAEIGLIEGYVLESLFGKAIEIKKSPEIGAKTYKGTSFQPITKPTGDLTIASLNVKNLFDQNFDTIENKSALIKGVIDSAMVTYEDGYREEDFQKYLESYLRKASDKAKISTLAKDIVNELHAPDIVALQEVQDNDGIVPSQNVSAGKTLEALTKELEKKGESYSYHQLDPSFPHSTSGQRGGNIRNAYLVKNNVGVTVSKLQKISEASNNCNRQDEPFCDGRFPLYIQILKQDKTIDIVNVHLKSNFLAVVSESRKLRKRQLQEVRKFIDSLGTNTIVLGDLNDDSAWDADAFNMLTEGEGALRAITLPDEEQFTHSNDGTFSQLDHVFVSENLKDKAKLHVSHFSTLRIKTGTDHDGLLLSLGF